LQKGENSMKTRAVIVVAVVAALALLALGGVALARGTGAGPTGWMGTWMGRGGYGPAQGTNAQGTPGVNCPMGGYGGYGPGGMMGGYQGNPGNQGNQGSPATPAVGVTQVTIQNFAFQPATIQVAKGTTVTWTNQDSAPHTIAFRASGMTGSGMLQRGQSFSYTFNTPGTYAYYCGVHPNMTGTVIVTP
jgi:plastocyanin